MRALQKRLKLCVHSDSIRNTIHQQQPPTVLHNTTDSRYNTQHLPDCLRTNTHTCSHHSVVPIGCAKPLRNSSSWSSRQKLPGTDQQLAGSTGARSGSWHSKELHAAVACCTRNANWVVVYAVTVAVIDNVDAFLRGGNEERTHRVRAAAAAAVVVITAGCE
jgi:hypothetical protein